MIKDYVFWGLFALVLFGVVATLIRDNRRRRQREAEEARSRPPVAPAPVIHVAKPPAAAFDPTATRIHVGAVTAGSQAVLLDREAPKLAREAVPKLVCVGGTQKDHVFPITAAGIRVGRDADNDIVITDARASHHHAWVGLADGKVLLRDLGSTNGTFLNAQLDAPVTEAVLVPGDTIFFGGHGRDQFRFVVE